MSLNTLRPAFKPEISGSLVYWRYTIINKSYAAIEYLFLYLQPQNTFQLSSYPKPETRIRHSLLSNPF